MRSIEQKAFGAAAGGFLLVFAIFLAALFVSFRILSYEVLADLAIVFFAGWLTRPWSGADEITSLPYEDQIRLDTAFLVLGAAMTLAATDTMRAVFGLQHQVPAAIAAPFVFFAGVGAALIGRFSVPLARIAARPRLISYVTLALSALVYSSYRVLAVTWPPRFEWTHVLALAFLSAAGLSAAGIAVAVFRAQGWRSQRKRATIFRDVFLLFLALVSLGLSALFADERPWLPRVQSRAAQLVDDGQQASCAARNASPNIYCVRVHYGSSRAVSVWRTLAFGDRSAKTLQLGYADVRLPLAQSPREDEDAETHYPIFNRRSLLREPDAAAERASARLWRGGGPSKADVEGAAFRQALAEDIRSSGGEVLLYVHGFNQSFDTALANAAQLAVDLTYADGRPIDGDLGSRLSYRAGTPVLFSWPTFTFDNSNAPTEKLGVYIDDRKRADASARHLAIFLRQLIDGGARKVNVVLHSMGNRVFMEALPEIEREIAELAATNEVEFAIIHAASEYDRIAYLQRLTNLRDSNRGLFDRLFANVSIYASSTDQALRLRDTPSDLLNADCAVGGWREQAATKSCQAPLVVTLSNAQDDARFVTIDASGFVLSPAGDPEANDLGHGYYLNSPVILADMGCAFEGIRPESGQRALELQSDGRWRFNPIAGTNPACRSVQWIKRTDDCERVAAATGYSSCDEIRARERAFDEWRPSGETRKVSGPVTAARFSGDCAVLSQNIRRESDRLIVYFGLNSSTIDQRQVAEIRAFVRDSGATTLRAEGYADSSGDEVRNLSLSLERAQAVSSAVGDRAVVIVEGRGEPGDAMEDSKGVSAALRCALNRRVELSIVRP